MQNTTMGKSAASTLHEVSEAVSGSADQMAEIETKVSKLATETKEAAGKYFDKAGSWLQGNYGKTIGILGFLAAVGTVAYLIGKNSSQSLKTPKEENQDQAA